MTGSLAGRVALVTGASKGIGKAIAAAFAAEGATVMLVSRKQEGLDAAAAEIAAEVPDARLETFAANAGEEDQIAACVDATVERLGALDVLVANAATNPYYGPTIDIDLGAWDKTFRVNLRGVLVWTQLAWRAWMQEHGGRVIYLSSVGGLTPSGALGVYDVTKAAVIHLSKVMAVELGPSVTVNCIAPGLVQTDFAQTLWQHLGEEQLARLPQPEDIAAAAVYLAGPGAARTTGHTLVVDAGGVISRAIV